MSSQGPFHATSGTDQGGRSNVTAWVNPNNITTQTLAKCNGSANAAQATSVLRGTGYGFSIPGGANIVGVLVEINKNRTSGDNVTDLHINLVLTGAIIGNDKSIGANWPDDVPAYGSYGGSSDTWGLSLTPGQVNDATFGAQLQGQGTINGNNYSVFDIRITVFYNLTQQVIAIVTDEG